MTSPMPGAPVRLTDEGRLTLYKKGLSPSEIQVCLAKMNYGASAACAKHLFVTEKTIKFHLTNIYKKLQIPKAPGLYALMAQLTEPTEKPPEPVKYSCVGGIRNDLPRGR